MKTLCLLTAGVMCVASASAQTTDRLFFFYDKNGVPVDASILSADGSTIAGVFGYTEGDFPSNAFSRWTLAAGLLVFPRSHLEPTRNADDFPRALSSDGSVIAGYGGRAQHSALRWSLDRGYQSTPQLESPNNQTDPRDMSNDGRLLVGMASTFNGYRPCVSDFNGPNIVNLMSIGAPTPPIFSGQAWAISASGTRIMGTYTTMGAGSTTVHCVWDNMTTRTALVKPPEFAEWYPSRMSGDGLTIGGACELPGSPGILRPFLWSAASGAQVLPAPPDATNLSVEFINMDGSTIVGMGVINNVRHTLLWRDGGVTTIDAYCDSRSVPRQTMHFEWPYGLSDDGKVLLIRGPLASGTYRTAMLRLAGAVAFCASDLGGSGGAVGPDGELDNNDFITFIAYFFARNARADVGSQGGLPGADFLLDNNDFIVFIDQFFHGCE